MSDFTTSSSEEELRDYSAHYDAQHHTLEQPPPTDLNASFAAKAVLGSGSAAAAEPTSGDEPAVATGAGAAASPQGTSAAPATPVKAEGPAPTGSPLDPGAARSSETKSHVPGAPVGLDTQALDLGRDLLQSFGPLRAVHEHVCAWHFYAHDMGRQVEAHHFCSHPSEEMRQCILFDSDQKGARLTGVEYIISERLFAELPPEEKRYWHSHSYEVGSGLLVAPGVPDIAERQDMQRLIGTYGKTWHTWQVDRGDPLPYGPPQLMMAFTADGQVRPELVAERDERYGVSTEDKGRQRRERLEWPEALDPAADHWQSGTAWQITGLEQVPVQGLRGSAAGAPAAGSAAGGSQLD